MPLRRVRSTKRASRSHRPILAITAIGLLLLALAPAAGAAQGPEGMLAVIAWDQPAGDPLARLDKDVRLLTQNQDLALLLLPTGIGMPASGREDLHLIEPLRAAAGDYYLVLLEDAQRAHFVEGVRVLFRRGHTVLVWSPEAPRLTPESRAQLRGLIQPRRVTLHPKPRPPVSSDEDQGAIVPRSGARTEFHPLIAQIVADVEQAEYVTQWQALDDFETRYYNTAQNEASAQYMYDLFESYGLQAEFHEYYQVGTRKNVIGILPGATQPERVVYITGHFDSISEDSQNHAPGADDNASGTTAFLEAARVLRNYLFEYTIKFVGFNGEEQGLIGSEAYVNSISTAGEDVVGCFNFDMIAYAGVDPAPPDLVIYTNTASLPLAELLRDACLEFVPADVEPVINTSAIGASDHASFWDYGYQAVLGIEEEAWGADFCPWYHTSDDRIEQYPQDYPTHCTMAAIAAVAQTALPLVPDEPYLVINDEAIDDDTGGASQGNGDGLPDYGETIELTLTLRNVGTVAASSVTGELLTEDAYISLLVAGASFGTIAGAGGTASNVSPLLFAIDPQVPDGHVAGFRLAISESPDTLEFEYAIRAPDLQAIGLAVDDAAGGDGDGTPEPGETVLLAVTLGNEGSATAVNVAGVLGETSAYLSIDPTPVAFGTLAPEGTAAGAGRAVTIDAGCPALYSALLSLVVTDDSGYDRTLPLSFYIGDVFAEDVEAGAGAWSHTNGSTGYTDEWHLETYRNHTYGGTTSWKCGGSGSGDYSDLLHAVLESSVFTLPPEAQITFWHWIDAEISTGFPGACYDGGLVEISLDGAPWESLTPAAGYPYLIRTGGTPGPFPADTPVWSGSHDWREETLDLSGYSGSARLRFIFGSDGAVTAEGWYLDDLQLHFSPSGAPGNERLERLTLHPARPNPALGATRLILELPAETPVAARVIDLGGRVVRALPAGRLPAGRHLLSWDGRDQAHRPVEAGVYWLQVRTPRERLRQQVVIVR
jgi:hypothetical protein